jgi:hypothetical protein
MRDRAETPWWRTKWAIVLLGFTLAAAFLLVTEHAAHAWGILPYLLLIACPLLHLFHGHGSHGHGHRNGAAGGGKS